MTWLDSRAVAKTLKGTVLAQAAPKVSDMSRSSGAWLSGSAKLNACRSWASISCTMMRPMFIPGQILRPDPKGNSWKLVPLKSLGRVQKPVRLELQRPLPHFGIPLNAPQIHEDVGPLGNVVLSDCAGLRG